MFSLEGSKWALTAFALTVGLGAIQLDNTTYPWVAYFTGVLFTIAGMGLAKRVLNEIAKKEVATNAGV